MQVQLFSYEARIASVYRCEVDTTLSQSHRIYIINLKQQNVAQRKEMKSQANFEQLAINTTPQHTLIRLHPFTSSNFCKPHYSSLRPSFPLHTHSQSISLQPLNQSTPSSTSPPLFLTPSPPLSNLHKIFSCFSLAS